MQKSTAFLLVLSLAACGGSDDAASSNDADRAGTATATANADGSVVQAGDVPYMPLNRQNLERWFGAFEDVMTLVASNEELVHVLDTEDTEESADAILRFHSEPRVVAAIRDNDLTTEQYFGIQNTLIGAMFTHSVAAENRQELPPFLREADIDFYVENQQWIEQQWNRINAMLPQDEDEGGDYDYE